MAYRLNRALKVNGEQKTVGSVSVRVYQYDENGKVLHCAGSTKPTDGDSGYAVGCRFIDTDGGANVTEYVNEGSVTSADFNAATPAGGLGTLNAATDTDFTAPSTGQIQVYDGTNSWDNKSISGDATLDNAGVLTVSDLTIATEAQGDLLRRGAAAWEKVVAKTDGYILIGDGTDIASVAVSGDVAITNAGVTTVTDLTISSEAQGDVMYFNGTNWVRLGAGTAGQALVTAGVGSNPYWGAPAGSLAGSLANTVTCEAGASDYTLDFGTAGGAYTLTVPAVAGARSFAFIDEAQAFTAVQTFTNEGVHILDTNASHDLVLKAGSDLTADRILTLTTGDAARTVTLGGDIALGGTLTTLGAWTQTGAHTIGITTTGATTVTLPTTGTLATLDGAESLSNKTLAAVKIASTDGIYDAGGDELLLFKEDTTPVNYLQVESGDTTVAPGLNALGSDANVDLRISPQGTGNVQVTDGTDITKVLDFEVAGATTAKTMSITSSHTDDRALTLPDATDTLVGKATADTLTNKTLDCDGTGNVVSNVNMDELDPVTFPTQSDASDAVYGVEGVIVAKISNQAAAVNIYNANAPFKFMVIDAWSVCTGGAGTWKLNNGANGGGTDLHSDVTVAVDTDIDRPVDLDDAAWTIAANGSLSIVPDGGGAMDAIIFVRILRITA
jgi:hypothetical protein